MIDHETARRSFATSLDFPLDQAEREALDEHLAGCPACRAEVAAIRADGAVLRELDLGPVPIAVRANIAIAAEHRQGGGSIGRWIAIVGVAALLVVALGGGLIGVGGRPGATAGPSLVAVDPGPAQIAWKTEVVVLTARDFSLVVGDKTFRAATPKIDVHSELANAINRTLEATWFENGVEMRLNLYFAGDATAWWVSEIRAYNGAQQGAWLVAKGTFFETPLGAGWTGDQDIDLAGPGGPGRLHLAGMTLVNQPSDVNKPVGGAGGGPIPVPIGSGPFDLGGPLHCSGILQMTPPEAEAALHKMDLKVTWRYHAHDDGSTEARPDPPVGTVIIGERPFVGPDGLVVIALADQGSPLAQPVPVPDDCLSGAKPNVKASPPAP